MHFDAEAFAYCIFWASDRRLTAHLESTWPQAVEVEVRIAPWKARDARVMTKGAEAPAATGRMTREVRAQSGHENWRRCAPAFVEQARDWARRSVIGHQQVQRHCYPSSHMPDAGIRLEVEHRVPRWAMNRAHGRAQRFGSNGHEDVVVDVVVAHHACQWPSGLEWQGHGDSSPRTRLGLQRP